jgi:hypothetical protein
MTTTRRVRFGLLALLALAASPAAAQAPKPPAESGFTLRETDVRAKPFLDAAAVGKLPERTAVTVQQRQGGWMLVKGADLEGWVRMLSVRLGNPDPKKNDTTFLTAIGFGKRPGGAPTATTGVRGFSEEDLKAARPSPEQLQKMDSFAMPIAGAAQFAAAGRLSPKPVPYVDANGKPVKEKK